MKKTLLLILPLTCLLLASDAFADVVTLKDGSHITGAVEVGFATDIRIRVGDKAQMIPIENIQSVQFDAPPAITTSFILPMGTEISIRTIDVIDSKKADEYKEYRASVEDAVVQDGVTVIPAMATAFLRVKVTPPKVSVKHLVIPVVIPASLSLRLIALNINERRVEVTADQIESKGKSHIKRDAGVGAAAGAGVGAIFGGLLGAGIGAAAGGLGGAVMDTVTGHVRIPSEARFTYKLPEPTVISFQESRQ